VGPRASLDAEARGKILCLCRGSNPGHPARSQTLYCLSYPGLEPVIDGRIILDESLRIGCDVELIHLSQRRAQ
jgi:hypothetical protein